MLYAVRPSACPPVLLPRPGFAVGKRVALFSGDYVTNTRHATYDVHPDGQRFVFVTGDRTEATDLILVQNLFSPGGK